MQVQYYLHCMFIAYVIEMTVKDDAKFGKKIKNHNEICIEHLSYLVCITRLRPQKRNNWSLVFCHVVSCCRQLFVDAGFKMRRLLTRASGIGALWQLTSGIYIKGASKSVLATAPRPIVYT